MNLSFENERFLEAITIIGIVNKIRKTICALEWNDLQSPGKPTTYQNELF